MQMPVYCIKVMENLLAIKNFGGLDYFYYLCTERHEVFQYIFYIKKMETTSIAAYRQHIVQCICQKAAERQLTMNEAEATRLVSLLDEDDLAMGMDWNTPEEVAELLLEDPTL